MGRYDNPCSVILLFAGAFVASFFLILLLNAEARYRKTNKEPEIANGNIFSALGNQLKRWITKNKSNGISTKLPDYDQSAILSVRRTRQLQSTLEEESHELEQRHHIRHRFKHRKKQERHSEPEYEPPVTSAETPVLVSEANHTDSPPEEVLQRHLDLQEGPCYSTNEVLLIIGLTCAVNFVFVFLIICLVNACNRKANHPKSDVCAEFGNNSQIPLLIADDSELYSCSPDHSRCNMKNCSIDVAFPDIRNFSKIHNNKICRKKGKNGRLTTALSMDDIFIKI